MKDLLKKLFLEYKIDFTDEKLSKLEHFYNIVIRENQKFNLTAIIGENDFAIKHFLDCALICNLIDSGKSVCDVGAGAGFPSIVLKILRDDLNITMVDSLQKRVNFLNNTILELGLKNIKTFHERVEDFALHSREKFDVCVARAVAGLNTLCEYCLPLTKVGGKFIAMKGSGYETELDVAKNAILTLGGKLETIKKIYIKEIDGTRANIVVDKVERCPSKYPRGKNLPKVKPIV